jgi:hypothetical protein
MPEIHVNGRDYQLVTLGELTLDEAMLVWDYTKLSLDQLGDLEGFHPGLIAALIHISVQRGEPGEPSRQIRQVVGRLPVAELENVFMDISEEVPDTDPPPTAASTNGGSGDGSSTSTESAPAASPRGSTGSRGSATGATSAPTTSAR